MVNIHGAYSFLRQFLVFLVVCLFGFLFFMPHFVAAHSSVSSRVCPGDAHRHSGLSQNDTDIICAGDIDYTLASASSAANIFNSLLSVVVGIVVTLSFLFFFWNLAKYVRDQEGKEEAKQKMMYSVIAIFVITSLWGIISFVRNVIGINSNAGSNQIELPSVVKIGCSNLQSEFESLIGQGSLVALQALQQRNAGCVAAGKNRLSRDSDSELTAKITSLADASIIDSTAGGKCPGVSTTWVVDGYTCTGLLIETDSGGSHVVSDQNADGGQGRATYTCNNGYWSEPTVATCS